MKQTSITHLIFIRIVKPPSMLVGICIIHPLNTISKTRFLDSGHRKTRLKHLYLKEHNKFKRISQEKFAPAVCAG